MAGIASAGSTPRVGAVDPTQTFALDAATFADASFREEWNALAASCAGTSYFQTADWIWGWWETVAERAPTTVACWRAPDGTLDAVAAVSRARAPLHRRLRISVPVAILAGCGPGDADHGGAVARDHRRDDVARWLARAARGRTLVAEALAPGAGIAPHGARVLEHNPCPRLALPAEAGAPDAPDGLGSLGRSANFRHQLRRYRRGVERAGIAFEWHAPGTVAPATVTALFDLHTRLRADRGRTTTLGAQHRELLLRCAERSGAGRGPAAVVARRGDAVLGVLLGFWWRRAFAAYQSGWDPACATLSLGSVLVAEAIERATAAGAVEFDFLRGTEGYKYRFGGVDRLDETVVVPAGAIGAAFVARGLALARRDARRRADGRG